MSGNTSGRWNTSLLCPNSTIERTSNRLRRLAAAHVERQAELEKQGDVTIRPGRHLTQVHRYFLRLGRR
jgi:hypothetical protein